MPEHEPVMLKEATEILGLKKGDLAVDATLGAGGYTLVLSRIVGDQGRVIALDRDAEAIAAFAERKPKNVSLVHGNFSRLGEILREAAVSDPRAIVADLGLSSDQLDDPDRGFSFRRNGPLDMRMDRDRKTTAREIVETWSEKELARIFSLYGDEPRAGAVARQIVRARAEREIASTGDLLEVILPVLGKSRASERIHPATRVFQALRMAVNREPEALRRFLRQAWEALAVGGRLAVVSFHSGEDRLVKEFARTQARGCVCPSDLPVCACGRKPTAKILTRKPILPSAEEIARNPRSRSAKLRALEKIS